MQTKETIVREIRAALEHDPRINLHSHPISVNFADSALVLEGEVENIAAKRLALKRATAINGTKSIVDKLRVIRTEHKGDGAIRDSVCRFILREPALRNCAVLARIKGQPEMQRERGLEPCGQIEVAVEDGVVTLTGEAASLSHKRLSEVLARWTPGCRDVVNKLKVVPHQEDNDDEITDTLRMVLERDPLIRDTGQILLRTRDRVVILQGLVKTQEERKAAELNAWHVSGVEDVVNRIEVQR